MSLLKKCYVRCSNRARMGWPSPACRRSTGLCAVKPSLWRNWASPTWRTISAASHLWFAWSFVSVRLYVLLLCAKRLHTSQNWWQGRKAPRNLEDLSLSTAGWDLNLQTHLPWMWNQRHLCGSRPTGQTGLIADQLTATGSSVRQEISDKWTGNGIPSSLCNRDLHLSGDVRLTRKLSTQIVCWTIKKLAPE